MITIPPIAAGQTGLVKSDLRLRAYSNKVYSSTLTSALTVVEIGGTGTYAIGGLQNTSDSMTITWEYPDGVGGVYRAIQNDLSAYTYYILPIKEIGLALSDLDVSLYKDNVLQSPSLTLTELQPGDYLLQSLPRESGSWTLTYNRYGIIYRLDWTLLESAFIEIVSIQSPFWVSLDSLERNMFSVNFSSICLPSTVDALEENMANIITTAGLATLGVDLFTSGGVNLPSGDGPYVTILNRSGIEPLETHNDDTYERPNIQIVVTAKAYKIGRAKIRAIWKTLDGVRGLIVVV